MNLQVTFVQPTPSHMRSVKNIESWVQQQNVFTVECWVLKKNGNQYYIEFTLSMFPIDALEMRETLEYMSRVFGLQGKFEITPYYED